MSLRAITSVIIIVTYTGIVLPELLITNYLLRELTNTIIKNDQQFMDNINQESYNIEKVKIKILNQLNDDLSTGIKSAKQLAESANKENSQVVDQIFDALNFSSNGSKNISNDISYCEETNPQTICSKELKSVSVIEISNTLNWEIIILFAVGVVFLIYVWRVSVVIGLSIEIPIEILSEVISDRMKNLEGEDIILSSFEQNFTSKTTTRLYKSLIDFLNHIKYSNNKFQIFGLNDAQALIQQSTSKQFYQEYANFRAVGISATNISRIHMKYKRYLEALNEQEESIIIGDQELQSLREYKEFVLDISNKIQFEMNFFKVQNLIMTQNQTLQKFKQKLTQKFKKFDDQWVSDLFSSKKKNRQYSAFSQGKSTQVKSNYQRSTMLRTTNTKRNFLQKSDNFDHNYSYNFLDFIGLRSVERNSGQNKKPHDIIKEEEDILRLRNNPQASFSKRSSDNTPLHGPLFNEIALIKEKTEKINKGTVYKITENEDPDGILTKLNEIKSEKRIVKEKLLMRKYQYACILFSYSIQEQKVFLMATFKEYLNYANQYPHKKSNLSQQNWYISNNFIRSGQTEKAQICLIEAQEILIKIQNHQDDLQNEDTNYIDIFKDIPIEILQDKIEINQSIVNIQKGQIYEAANSLVKIIERKGYYDQEQIKFAISTLKKFMKEYQLSLNYIEDLEISLKQKKFEMIILVDYSSKISREQLILSHSIIKYLLDDSSPSNEIGLYAFNEILYESFPLQTKSSYLNLLEETIKQLLIYPGGTADIFKILEIAACYLFDMKTSTLLRQLQCQYQKEKQLRESKPLDTCEGYNQQTQTMKTSPLDLNFQMECASQIMDFIHNSMKPKGDPDENYESVNSMQDVPFDIYAALQIDPELLKSEEKDRTRQRYIFLFAEGTKDFSDTKLKRLKIILQKKNIDLIVFNISSQNCNMIYLKLLSTLTENSKFLSSQEEITAFSKSLKEFKSEKRMYLEFY